MGAAFRRGLSCELAITGSITVAVVIAGDAFKGFNAAAADARIEHSSYSFNSRCFGSSGSSDSSLQAGSLFRTNCWERIAAEHWTARVS